MMMAARSLWCDASLVVELLDGTEVHAALQALRTMPRSSRLHPVPGLQNVHSTRRSVSGVARLYGSETDTEFLTFSETDPLSGQMFLEPGDEMWVLADSTDVVIESILVGVAA